MSSTTSPPIPDDSSAIAELFLSEGHQAVRLPEQFSIDADSVTVRRAGTGILIEPVSDKPRVTSEELDAWFAKLAYFNELYGPFMPEGRDQPAMPVSDPDGLFD